MGSVIRLDSDEQLRAIADPNRSTILRRLMVQRATISQLGEAFGRHPAWIRHHVKTLEAAGLVALVETRTTRNYTEKFYAATASAFVAEYSVRPSLAEGAPPLIFASSDFAMTLLAGDDEMPRALTAVTGSLESLIAVRQGLADVAGCHLLDAPTGEYNVPYVRHLFPDRPVVVSTLVHREQGLIVAEGNPLALKDIADLATSGVRFINRNRGSGTRVWLDSALSQQGIEHEAVTGYEDEVITHSHAAQIIADKRADVAVGVRAAADALGLGFVPLFTERYDLVIPADLHETAALAPLLDHLHSGAFRSQADRLHGYDTRCTGQELRVTA